MYKKYIKRWLDVVAAAVALIILSPLLLLIAIAIKLFDPGPVFYLGPRVGKDGKVFKMYKFRTMIVNAPDIRNADGSTFNAKNDPRLTKIGKFLRETSLDELAQFINVLKGDMSLIGPRPGLQDNLHLYTPEELQKWEVRPGITGYNQAFYRNNLSLEERRKNDVYYVKNLTFWLDVKIFVATILVVLQRKSIYNNSSPAGQQAVRNKE
ncbi:sugar transferase [Paenibacillus ginsengihumi]|uniref:sugar transferase n=1 Tax=Paenibacillus ginsengihumi TaxID=431596 RepID=UPI00036E2C48|nr:sugar transferase [Paenibacillus ginsengihumi]